MLPPCSVERFHIYFPDPWPKNKHRRRRFLRLGNLSLLCSILKPEGQIFFLTDFFDYYLQTKVLLCFHSGLTLSEDPFPLEANVSLYGKKFIARGKTIYFLSAKKLADNRVPEQKNEKKVEADPGKDENG